MLRKREELHKLFCDILQSDHAYFQPPESIKIEYPAIIYSILDINNGYADDSVYLQDDRYRVVVIDKDPESEIAKKVSMIPTCSWDRNYKQENLNHFSFNLYY